MNFRTRIITFLKLCLVLASLTSLIFGWIKRIENIAVLGAIFYLLTLCIDIFLIISDSLKYRNDRFIKKVKKTFIEKMILTIQGLITLSGLIVILFEDNLYKNPGMIIWIGTIIVYALSGIIVSSITNLPLKMGYGGWHLSYKRKRNK